MTGEFSQKDFGQYVNDDNNVIVKIATDDFDGYEPLRLLSVEQYVSLLRSERGIKPGDLKSDEGLNFIEWDDEFGGEPVRITACFFRSAKGFRIAQFFLFGNSAEEFRDDVPKWARSVTFEK